MCFIFVGSWKQTRGGRHSETASWAPFFCPKTVAGVVAGAVAASICNGATAKRTPKEFSRAPKPAQKIFVPNVLKSAMCMVATVGNTVMESCKAAVGPARFVKHLEIGPRRMLVATFW